MRKLIAEKLIGVAKKFDRKFVDAISRRREARAGVSPGDPKSADIRRQIKKRAKKTAKKIYKGTAVGSGATATGGGVLAVSNNKPKPKPKTKTNPEPKPSPKPSPKPKYYRIPTN